VQVSDVLYICVGQQHAQGGRGCSALNGMHSVHIKHTCNSLCWLVSARERQRTPPLLPASAGRAVAELAGAHVLQESHVHGRVLHLLRGAVPLGELPKLLRYPHVRHHRCCALHMLAEMQTLLPHLFTALDDLRAQWTNLPVHQCCLTAHATPSVFLVC
jgi:hypothetical protein